MMFGVPSEPFLVNAVVAQALETWLILHADHEQNASTSTVRIAGSSYANPYACIASGISMANTSLQANMADSHFGLSDSLGPRSWRCQ